MAACVPFSRPSIGDEEIAAVTRVLRSGWLTAGPETDAFEREASTFLGAPEAVAVSSCSAGLHLSLLALGIGPGDEVVTSPLTFVSAVHAIRHTGATPVFCDVDPRTLNPDAACVRARVTPRTRAVLALHYGGRPFDATLRAVCERAGVPLVADAAHAFGSRARGNGLEALAHLTVYSFYATKTLTTAEGGLVTGRADLLEDIRRRRNNGLTAPAHRRRIGNAYDVTALGFKYTLPDVLGAIGRAQLQRAPWMLARRREVAREYSRRLAGLVGVQRPPFDEEMAWWLYTVRIERPWVRDEVQEQLLQAGVHTSVLFPLVTSLTFYAENGVAPGHSTPVAAAAASELLCLPCFPDIRDDEIAFVVDALAAALDRPAQ